MSVRGFTATLAAVRFVCVVSIVVRINKRASSGRCYNSYHEDKSWIPRLAQIVLFGETLVASDYQPFAEESSGVVAPDAASETTSGVSVNHSFGSLSLSFPKPLRDK